MYHSRVSSTSCCLANSRSISASGMQWNARSQAAYHGIFPLVRHRNDVGVVQMLPVGVAAVLALGAAAAAGPGRPQPVAARRNGRTACDQIMPAKAWRCTSRASASCDVVLQVARRTHPPRAMRSAKIASKSSNGSRRLSRGAAAGALRAVPPAGIVSWYEHAALVPVRSGFTASCVAVHDDTRGMPSLK